MSFDIYLGCFADGELSTFPRKLVEQAFGANADQSNPTCWRLTYPDGGFGDLYVDDEPDVDGFSVNRPPGSPQFWEAVLDIMRQTPSVLYWAGDGCCVADAAVIDEMPPDMIESLGVPTVVSTIDEIGRLIEQA